MCAHPRSALCTGASHTCHIEAQEAGLDLGWPGRAQSGLPFMKAAEAHDMLFPPEDLQGF